MTIVVGFPQWNLLTFLHIVSEVPVDSIDVRTGVCRSHGNTSSRSICSDGASPRSVLFYVHWDGGSVVMEWQAVHENPANVSGWRRGRTKRDRVSQCTK